MGQARHSRQKGVIRDAAHAFSTDGGLAVLYGNLAIDGRIVKTAGVDVSILTFSGPARVFESQDATVTGVLGGLVKAGDIVPRGQFTSKVGSASDDRALGRNLVRAATAS